jgi:hypothetical protein
VTSRVAVCQQGHGTAWVGFLGCADVVSPPPATLPLLPQVRDYKEQLSRQPASAEEFVAHLHLIEEIEAQRPQLDKEFVLVSPTRTVLYASVRVCAIE